MRHNRINENANERVNVLIFAFVRDFPKGQCTKLELEIIAVWTRVHACVTDYVHACMRVRFNPIIASVYER